VTTASRDVPGPVPAPGGSAALPVRATARAFWLPKYADAEGEWADGAALSEAALRFAVADGASAGFASRAWALSLVLEFRDAPPPLLSSQLTMASWFARIGQRHDAQVQSAARSGWMYRAGLREGSSAAFLGIRFWPVPGGQLGWEAVAVGDTCLLHVRAAGLVAAFPLTSPDQFTTHPPLVRSQSRSLEALARNIHVLHGHAAPGDLFLLATDEMSRWLLRHDPADPIWGMLGRLGQGDLHALVAAELDAGRMEHDDITLARVLIHR